MQGDIYVDKEYNVLIKPVLVQEETVGPGNRG